MQLRRRNDRPSRAWPWVACPVVGAGLLAGLATMHPAAFVATALLAAAAAGGAGCLGAGERYLEEHGTGAWLARTAGAAAMLTAAVGAFAAGGTGALALGAAVLATGWVFLVHGGHGDHGDHGDHGAARATGAPSSEVADEPGTRTAGAGGTTGVPGAADAAAVVDAGCRVTGPPDDGGADRAGAARGREVEVRLEDLTDAQLRQRWRVSYLQVRAASDPARLARLATDRQAYLDEMQRRHPDGFAAWLAAGAAPGSDPSPFFSSRLSP